MQTFNANARQTVIRRWYKEIIVLGESLGSLEEGLSPMGRAEVSRRRYCLTHVEMSKFP